MKKNELGLIIPTNRIIEEYCNYWKLGKGSENAVKSMYYKETTFIDCNIDFYELKAGEDALNPIFERISKGDEDSIIPGIVLLDSIYHTQIKDSLDYAIKLKESIIDNNLIKRIQSIKNTQDENMFNKDAYLLITLIATCRNDAKQYSFATKFCNRINPDVFPILDGYVAKLLWYYLNEMDTNTYADKSTIYLNTFGNYNRFIQAYSLFKDKYEIKNKTYKEIDEFMWTYGKVLNTNNSFRYDVSFLPYES